LKTISSAITPSVKSSKLVWKRKEMMCYFERIKNSGAEIIRTTFKGENARIRFMERNPKKKLK